MKSKTLERPCTRESPATVLISYPRRQSRNSDGIEAAVRNDEEDRDDVLDGRKMSRRKPESVGFTWSFVMMSATSTRPHGLEQQ